MKNILYLGSVFLVLIGTQISLEQKNIIAPQGTDTELDSLNTRYKVENGKLYFLSNDGIWINRNHFVWQGSNGHYYLEEDGQIFQSDDGTDWNLFAAEPSTKHSESSSNQLH